MKKIICMLLSIVIILSLCGCFSGKSNVVDDTLGEATTEDLTQESSAEEQEEDLQENQSEFSFGQVENNVYTNEFLGLSCALPSDWEFYSEEKILELNNITKEYIDDDYKEQIENATIIYDMFAQTSKDNIKNINVNLEKLNPVQAALLDIKSALEAQKEAIISTYQNMGYTNVQVTFQKVIVDNKEYDSTKIVAKTQGIDFYAMAFTFKKSDYLVNVTVCSAGKDNTSDIFEYFTIQ